MTPKRVVIVTGARSEYGLLKPVVHSILGTTGLDLRIIATGVHRLEEFGHTIDEVRSDFGDLVVDVPFYEDANIDDDSLPRAIGRGTTAIGSALSELEADIVLVLGDRAEALAAALAAYSGNRVVVHIHGGDRTDSGHIDEGFRHAITRIAHVHFAASDASARRLLDMGEEPWRVHCTGSPSIDRAMEIAQEGPGDVRERYGLPAADPFAIFLFHPDRIMRESSGDTATTILDRVQEAGLRVFALYPNSDEGSTAIIEAIREAARRSDRVVFRESIPRDDFLRLQSCATLMIGNSSAGVIETACFGLPVVNVGERNRDREPGENVIFAEATAESTGDCIRRALEDEVFREAARTTPCPYGKGNAAAGIAQALAELELDTTLYRKQLVL